MELLYHVVEFFVLVGIGAGLGAALALLRVVLPGVARAADRSLEGLGTWRMLLTGLLPILGALLVATAVEASDSAVLRGALGLLVFLPGVLLAVAGAMSGVPFLGRRLLARGEEVGPLRQAMVGGAVLGLATVTFWIKPLGLAVALLVESWFLGIGLGTLLGRRSPSPAEPAA
jgi:hypothetical protein